MLKLGRYPPTKSSRATLIYHLKRSVKRYAGNKYRKVLMCNFIDSNLSLNWYFLCNECDLWCKKSQTAKYRCMTFADCRLQTTDCMRQQDCKLNETKKYRNQGGVIINITLFWEVHVRPRSEVFSHKLHRPDSWRSCWLFVSYWIRAE